MTSTSVATNGADALAGSTQARRRTNGKHRTGDGAEENDADQAERDGERDEHVVRTVEIRPTVCHAMMRIRPIEPNIQPRASPAPSRGEPRATSREAALRREPWRE